MTTPYGPGVPTAAGPGDMTVDEFLADPYVIERAILAVPNQYFIGETLLRDGGVHPSGVVQYNQLLDLDLYPVVAGPQPTDVGPDAELPLLRFEDRYPLFAEAKLNGAAFLIYNQEARRDRRDLVRSRLLRTTNKIRQIHNAKVITAILTDATVVANQTHNAAAKWDTSTPDCLADVEAAISEVDNSTELGYESDFILLHQDAFDELQSSARVQAYKPDSPSLNPLFKKQVQGLKGLNWIVSNRMPRATAIVGQTKAIGELVTEVPPFVEVIPEPLNRRRRITAGRQEVAVITDPYAISVIANIF